MKVVGHSHPHYSTHGRARCEPPQLTPVMRSPLHVILAVAALPVCLGPPASGAALQSRPDVVAKSEAVVVPIRVRSGHVYVDVEINGQGPFHFLFDTGAVNVLTPDAAKRLALSVRNGVEVTGTGGLQSGGVATVDAVTLHGVTLSKQTFYLLALPPGTSDDAPVDGLIGFEWLNRFPARLDYAGGTLTLFTGAYPPETETRPASRLLFRGRIPEVDGRIDGVDGRFTIDTGSAASLTLAAPFVAEHDLAARYHAVTRVMSGRGIGGPVYALAARAEQLDFGGVTARRPVTFLSQQKSGTSARKDTAGNIGFGVLRQFTILFDYPRKRISFSPNADWGQPDLADRSGLRLERSKGAFTVAFVAEGSPAAAAGLKAGDRILAANSAPADSLALGDVRQQLKGPVGSRVDLTTDRGPVVVVLADL